MLLGMVDSALLVVLRSNGLVDAEPDLNGRLLQGFLEQLLAGGRLPGTMIFMGSAIFLTTEGSQVLELLKRLAAEGTDLASCLTCLEYYKRRDLLRVGREGNMKQTVQAMLEAAKVITF
jgi:hypothetical protein